MLGMGKLGGGELNLSSDIDLIYCYPEPGTTDSGRKSLSNQEFFIRVGQRVIKLLDAKTVDGFVFRVDMRLRPLAAVVPWWSISMPWRCTTSSTAGTGSAMP